MIKRLFIYYKLIISYAFFGVCTTIVNIATYFICTRYLLMTTGTSTTVAWIIAVAFAFVTNKVWVFESESWNQSVIIKELCSFVLCRIGTGILDLSIMLIFVDMLSFNDVIIKPSSNMLVIILNYIASKMIIFKKKRKIL